jgi:glyoxylase-like metal-dependent hydrolase (beta-lactamase superfamily II)
MPKGYFTYLIFADSSQKLSFPVYSWLIEGADEPILVDVGCTAQEIIEFMGNGKEVEAIEPREIAPIEDYLAKFGLSTLDIKTVIMTQLHIDHILGVSKFPNAKFIVQEEELEFNRNPHPMFSRTSTRQLYEGLKLETIKGDVEIIPGVEAIFTPGHTPGGQSVAVTTEQGKVVICGMCTIDQNFSSEEIIIPGMHSNPIHAYDSIVKIRQIADTILPLHSQSLLNTTAIP